MRDLFFGQRCEQNIREFGDNHLAVTSFTPTEQRTNARYAVVAGFLGWTFDAFDFFVLVFTVSAISKDFGRSIPAVALTITASLATRPVGAFIFGLLADRQGRRVALMANILFFSVMEVGSGLARPIDVAMTPKANCLPHSACALAHVARGAWSIEVAAQSQCAPSAALSIWSAACEGSARSCCAGNATAEEVRAVP